MEKGGGSLVSREEFKDSRLLVGSLGEGVCKCDGLIPLEDLVAPSTRREVTRACSKSHPSRGILQPVTKEGKTLKPGYFSSR